MTNASVVGCMSSYTVAERRKTHPNINRQRHYHLSGMFVVKYLQCNAVGDYINRLISADGRLMDDVFFFWKWVLTKVKQYDNLTYCLHVKLFDILKAIWHDIIRQYIIPHGADK